MLLFDLFSVLSQSSRFNERVKRVMLSKVSLQSYIALCNAVVLSIVRLSKGTAPARMEMNKKNKDLPRQKTLHHTTHNMNHYTIFTAGPCK